MPQKAKKRRKKAKNGSGAVVRATFEASFRPSGGRTSQSSEIFFRGFIGFILARSQRTKTLKIVLILKRNKEKLKGRLCLMTGITILCRLGQHSGLPSAGRTSQSSEILLCDKLASFGGAIGGKNA